MNSWCVHIFNIVVWPLMSQQGCRSTGKDSEKGTKMTGHGILPHKQSLNRFGLRLVKQSLKRAMQADGLRILTARELLRVSHQQIPPSSPAKMSLYAGEHHVFHVFLLPFTFHLVHHASLQGTSSAANCRSKGKPEDI